MTQRNRARLGGLSCLTPLVVGPTLVVGATLVGLLACTTISNERIPVTGAPVTDTDNGDDTVDTAPVEAPADPGPDCAVEPCPPESPTTEPAPTVASDGGGPLPPAVDGGAPQVPNQPVGDAGNVAPTVDAAPPTSPTTPPPVTDPMFVAFEPVTRGLEVQSLGSPVAGNQLPLGLRIVNTSGESVELSEVVLRYYFVNDGAGIPEFSCDSAEGVSCENIQSEFVESQWLAGEFIELGFDSDASLLAGGTAELNGTVSFSSNEPQSSVNDYSFNSSAAFATNSKVLAYRSAELAWGAPPTTELVEAETGVPVGEAVVSTLHDGYSADGMIAFVISEGSGITDLTVSTENAGPTELFVRYAQARNGLATGTLGVIVNGTRQTTAAFHSTGQWPNWSTASVRLNLAAGMNDVAFVFEAADSGWANLDALWLGPLPE